MWGNRETTNVQPQTSSVIRTNARVLPGTQAPAGQLPVGAGGGGKRPQYVTAARREQLAMLNRRTGLNRGAIRLLAQ